MIACDLDGLYVTIVIGMILLFLFALIWVELR